MIRNFIYKLCLIALWLACLLVPVTIYELTNSLIGALLFGFPEYTLLLYFVCRGLWGELRKTDPVGELEGEWEWENHF